MQELWLANQCFCPAPTPFEGEAAEINYVWLIFKGQIRIYFPFLFAVSVAREEVNDIVPSWGHGCPRLCV